MHKWLRPLKSDEDYITWIEGLIEDFRNPEMAEPAEDVLVQIHSLLTPWIERSRKQLEKENACLREEIKALKGFQGSEQDG